MSNLENEALHLLSHWARKELMITTLLASSAKEVVSNDNSLRMILSSKINLLENSPNENFYVKRAFGRPNLK